MFFISRINLTKENYLSLILAFFPISFIAGNMIININIILLIISVLIIFKSEILKIKFFFLDRLLLAYFVLILFTAIINDYYFYTEGLSWKGYFSTILKSIFFLRYLLLYIILRFLIEKKIINLKFFFIFSSLSVLFVCFDIFFQFFNGKDIFGFAAYKRKLSGPFGDELIAGGYIQRFSLFAFFTLPIFFYKLNLNKFFKLLIPILFIIFFTALILSGNRMPAIMFLLSIFLILIFQKQLRKFFFLFLIIFPLIAGILFQSNQEIRANFTSFYSQVSKMSVYVADKNFFDDEAPQYLKEFSTFYHTWLMNKYIGGGIKNFRYYCLKRPGVKKDSEFICNMHPHNYYLEILAETGIIGFSLISLFFLLLLYQTFIKKYFMHSVLKNNNIIIPFIFLFITEIFPIKSTGSFFTTGNTTYLFILMGILVGLIRKENLIENKS